MGLVPAVQRDIGIKSVIDASHRQGRVLQGKFGNAGAIHPIVEEETERLVRLIGWNELLSEPAKVFVVNRLG